MKILMVTDFYGIGQQYQDNLIAKYYNTLGHEVFIITSTFQNVFDYANDNYDNSVGSFIEYDNKTTIYRTPYQVKIKNLIKLFKNIKNRVEEVKPDLIYFHNISFNIHQTIPYLKKNKDARMILDFHVDYSNAGQTWKSKHILHGFLRKNYLHRFLDYFKIIYPIVPNGMTFVKEVYKVPENRMKLLPLGYDELETEDIQNTVDRTAIRNKLGIGEEDFLIISGGKFAREKRTELLLQACNLLDNKRIHVGIFGSPTAKEQGYADSLRQEANERVHFLGWLNGTEILTYMHAADLAVYPSSQSVLWQQSIGMYLPLIVGDSGNQDPSYLNQNNNLIILKGDDICASKIAYWIDKITSDEALFRNMRQGAEKTANELLKYTVICQTTLKDAFDK